MHRGIKAQTGAREYHSIPNTEISKTPILRGKKVSITHPAKTTTTKNINISRLLSVTFKAKLSICYLKEQNGLL